MRKVVLIGGAPTVGKSYLGRLLAEELKLPWISTDTIRGVMEKICSKKKYPNLFYFVGDKITAVNYLSSHTPQQIVDDQNKESREVWEGVKALVETDYVWKNFIVEGVAVIPELVANLKLKATKLFPIFLIQEGEVRTREVVYKRGLWDDADTYPDEVKPIEVQWTKPFNVWLKKEAEKYGYNVSVIGDVNKTFESITQQIKLWLTQ